MVYFISYLDLFLERPEGFGFFVETLFLFRYDDDKFMES